MARHDMALPLCDITKGLITKVECTLFRAHLLLHHIARGTFYVTQGLSKASQTRVFGERVQPNSPPIRSLRPKFGSLGFSGHIHHRQPY